MNADNLYNYGEVIFADEKLISMYTDYLDVLTNTWSEQKNDVVLFSESHDSFLGLGYTRDKSSQEITCEYAHVVDNYPKRYIMLALLMMNGRVQQLKKFIKK